MTLRSTTGQLEGEIGKLSFVEFKSAFFKADATNVALACDRNTFPLAREGYEPLNGQVESEKLFFNF